MVVQRPTVGAVERPPSSNVDDVRILFPVFDLVQQKSVCQFVYHKMAVRSGNDVITISNRLFQASELYIVNKPNILSITETASKRIYSDDVGDV